MDCDVWKERVTSPIKTKVVGFCGEAPEDAFSILNKIAESLFETIKIYFYVPYVAAISVRLFTQKAHNYSLLKWTYCHFHIQIRDNFETVHEQIIAADIVDYYRDLIRLGEDSDAMKKPGVPVLPDFNDVFTARINAVYKKNKLRALEPQAWPA